MRRAHIVAVFSVWAFVASPLGALDDRWTPETMMQVRRVSAVTPSPDGARVAFVVGEAVMEGEKSEWLSHIHLAAADGSGSRQLTRGEKSATSPKWSPDDKWIGFLSSRSGKANVWRISPDGGEAEMITDVKHGVSAFDWSPDGKSLALVMRDRKTDDEEKASKEKRDWRTIDENVKMSRLYVAPVEKGADGKREPKLLTPGSYTVGRFDWAPDGRTIVFEHQLTPLVDHWPRSDVSVVAVADGSVTPLAATPAAEAKPAYSPDGRWIAFTKSVEPTRWAQQTRVHVVAAGGGAVRALGATPDDSPAIIGWTADGRQVLAGEADRVTARVYAVPLDGSPPSAIATGSGSVGPATLNAAGTTLGFVSQDTDRAPEPFVVASGGGQPRQVATVQRTFPAAARTETVMWKSKDGRTVEGLLTYPDGYQTGTRVPLLLVIHGGPAGVFTRSFIGNASPSPLAVFAAKG